jgi:hypothetical protein
VAAIECLKKGGGSATIEEMEEDVAEKLRLSDAARAIPHGEGAAGKAAVGSLVI